MARLTPQRLLEALLRRYQVALEGRLREVRELLEGAGELTTAELVQAVRRAHRPIGHT